MTAALPARGRSWESIEDDLVRMRADEDDPRASLDDRWLNDRGLLVDDGVLEAAMAAARLFFTKNNSHAAILRLEQDLVAMGLDLFNGGPTAVGAITSGGSESLFLVAAAAMAHAGARPGRAEVLMADTGYPAFEKYGRYLGYRVRRVPADDAFRADPTALEAAITQDTILIVASMPSWAH